MFVFREGLQFLQRLLRRSALARQGKSVTEKGDRIRLARPETFHGLEHWERFGEIAPRDVGESDVKVRQAESGVKLEDLAILFDRLLVVAGDVVARQADVHSDDGVQRVELFCAAYLRTRLLRALQHRQVVRIPLVRRWVVGVELDGTPKPFLGAVPVPLEQILQVRQSRVGLGQAFVELERPDCRRPHLR